MKNSILIIFALLMFASCKPSKVTTISEKIRIDTVRDYKVITKYNAVHDTLTIDNPCDSTGILSNFYSKITVPQGKIIIRSYKGKIQATVNIDSIANVYENKYRSKKTDSSQINTKIVTKTVYPSWLVIAFILETLLISGYLYFKFIFIKL